MKTRIALRIVAAVVTLLIFMTTGISGSFFLTNYLYRITGHRPSAFLAQAINSLVGLGLCFLVISGISLYVQSTHFRAKHRDRAMGVYGPIIEALGRIAKGDFSIRVGLDDRQRDGMLGELARSVDNMAQELSQIEAMRQEFVSNVSHEIQSPLTSIRGFARALQDDHLGLDDRHHYLAIIETESMRLSRITENLLRLASLESAQARLELKTYRLDRQIRDLILACEPQWSDKGIEMDVSLQETTVTADEDLLSQVWVNLIYNSIKFTPAGGRVCIELRQPDGRAEFRIADTGIGIPEEDQPHVFERFYKADKARVRARGGSGLGLAIAKKIVDMHGGTIGLESRPGLGATFVVSLPSS